MDETTREVARLWALAQPMVSAFIASQVRDFRDRDDILQDVAVGVLDSYPSYDPSRPFVGWAIGIARNQISSHLRRKGRDRLVFDSAVIDRIESAFAEIHPHEIHLLDYLEECIRLLDGRARQICECRYRDDLKPDAIARTLGMRANSVSKALQRIREQLRDCIGRKASAEGQPI